MSDGKESRAGDNRERKRAQFTEADRPKGRWKLIVGLAAVAAVAGYLGIRIKSNDSAATAIKLPAATPGATQASSGGAAADVKIPLAEVGGRAKFFDYPLPDGTPIRFFTLRLPGGEYRAAFDACEVCAHAKKGYYQEGDQMVCRNCMRTFAIDQIGKVSSGCHPISLTPQVEGSSLVIKAGELEKGRHYF